MRRLRPPGNPAANANRRPPARLHPLLPQLRHRRPVGRGPHLPPLRHDPAMPPALQRNRRPLPRLRRPPVPRRQPRRKLRRRTNLPRLRRLRRPQRRILPQLRPARNRRRLRKRGIYGLLDPVRRFRSRPDHHLRNSRADRRRHRHFPHLRPNRCGSGGKHIRSFRQHQLQFPAAGLGRIHHLRRNPNRAPRPNHRQDAATDPGGRRQRQHSPVASGNRP